MNSLLAVFVATTKAGESIELRAKKRIISHAFFSITTGASPRFPQLISSQLIIQKAAAASFPFFLRVLSTFTRNSQIYYTRKKGKVFVLSFSEKWEKKRGKSKHVHFPGRNYKGGREVYFPTEAVSFPQNIRTNGIWKYGHCENFPIFGIYRISKCGNLMHRMTSEVRGKHTFLCMNRN